ncbi:MAG: hydrogenase maturation nickel metallochaperone HypA [Dehalococcoidales bacterium]|nr:hydrogenase maturation nickel metallochaperone HypA [Dehalococcoidales bacterium]
MHELAITQSLFEIVLEHARQAKAKKVKSVNLVIGEMTGVVGDSVQFYLGILSKDTMAAGLKANIRMAPPQATCRACGKTFIVPEMAWRCPDCGSTELEVNGGKELFVESIEVE